MANHIYDTARAPGRTARAVTQRSSSLYSGKGMLTAELLVGFALVAIRLVADAEVADDGTTVKANVLHPAGQFGPIPILAGLIGTFFLLSFVVTGGGTKAKLAVIMGGAIILTLGVRSLPEIEKIASTFGKIGTITAPQPQGSLSDIFGDTSTAGTGGPPALGNIGSLINQGVQDITPGASVGSVINRGVQGITNPANLFPTVSPGGVTPASGTVPPLVSPHGPRNT